MYEKNNVQLNCFNDNAAYPYDLKNADFAKAMQDVYDLLYAIDKRMIDGHWGRLADLAPKQTISGLLSALLGGSLANASHSLVVNALDNGHPDLLLRGSHPRNSAQSAEEGSEVKSTVKSGGAVDMHGAREHWLCVFVYDPDTEKNDERPFKERKPITFTEVYLSHVTTDMYRKNGRGELGTRTATLDAAGLLKFRKDWVYRLPV